MSSKGLVIWVEETQTLPSKCHSPFSTVTQAHASRAAASGQHGGPAACLQLSDQRYILGLLEARPGGIPAFNDLMRVRQQPGATC
jgi:hypothetical protein